MTDVFQDSIAYLLGELLRQAQYICEKPDPTAEDIAELRKRGKRYHAALLDAGEVKVTLTAKVIGYVQ